MFFRAGQVECFSAGSRVVKMVVKDCRWPAAGIAPVVEYLAPAGANAGRSVMILPEAVSKAAEPQAVVNKIAEGDIIPWAVGRCFCTVQSISDIQGTMELLSY